MIPTLFGLETLSHERILIPAINNIVLGAGLPVTIDSTTGLLGVATSSQRFKEHIKPMDKASEALLALKPVTFQYKSDSKGTPQFGLIAEEVAKVDPDLVVRDRNREIYSVRYKAVNAMLLNEFLKSIAKWRLCKQAWRSNKRTSKRLSPASKSKLKLSLPACKR